MEDNNISKDNVFKNIISKITRKNYKILSKIDNSNIKNSHTMNTSLKPCRKKILAKRLRDIDNGLGKEGSLERELTKTASNFFIKFNESEYLSSYSNLTKSKLIIKQDNKKNSFIRKLHSIGGKISKPKGNNITMKNQNLIQKNNKNTVKENYLDSLNFCKSEINNHNKYNLRKSNTEQISPKGKLLKKQKIEENFSIYKNLWEKISNFCCNQVRKKISNSVMERSTYFKEKLENGRSFEELSENMPNNIYRYWVQNLKLDNHAKRENYLKIGNQINPLWMQILSKNKRSQSKMTMPLNQELLSYMKCKFLNSKQKEYEKKLISVPDRFSSQAAFNSFKIQNDKSQHSDYSFLFKRV